MMRTLLLILLASTALFAGDKHTSRITDEMIPLDPDKVPSRPEPILELGEPFLDTGTLSPGFTLPTGAVWQPSLLVFGTFRTAVQSHPGVDGDTRTDEWANRLDLFANLQLSGSERIVMGTRNLDDGSSFSGYVFDSDLPGVEDGGVDEVDADLEALFFEGDFGEIFPLLSRNDFTPNDIGFAVGRQPLFFQEGMLINDAIDGIGLTKNSLQPNKVSNLRTTFFYGWDQVSRQRESGRANALFALLTSLDTRFATYDIDVAHVTESGARDDLTVAGASAVFRRGFANVSLRMLGSFSDDTGRDGAMAFVEYSLTPVRSYNLLYINAFAAMDNFTAAAIGPGTGPLGRVGINFAGVGLGNFGAPLSGATSEVAGGALGYQMFLNHKRSQLVLELAARQGLDDIIGNDQAFTARYQTAMGRRMVWVFDAFVNHLDATNETAAGGRVELLVKF